MSEEDTVHRHVTVGERPECCGCVLFWKVREGGGEFRYVMDGEGAGTCRGGGRRTYVESARAQIDFSDSRW